MAGSSEPDARSLSDKLADKMKPRTPVFDVRNTGARLVGTAYDIDRMLQACRGAMNTIENDKLDPHEPRTVVVPPPDPS